MTASRKKSAGVSRRLAAILAVTTLVQILATAACLSLTAIAPLVARDLGVDGHLVGYQVSLVYLSGIVASAYAGRSVRHFGAARVEAICLITFAGGLFAFATGSIAAIAFGAAIIGIGYGLQNPAASALLRSATPERARNLVFSVKQSGVPLGALIASLSFPALSEAIGWRPALIVAAVLILAAGTALFVSEPRAAGPGTEGPARGYGFVDGQRLLLRSPQLRSLAFLSLAYSVVQLSFSTFVVTALVEDGTWSLVAAGAAAGIMHGAGAVGRIGWGVVADRYGDGLRVLGLIGLMGSVLALAFAFALESGAGALTMSVLLAGVGVSWIGWNGVMLAEVARYSPPDAVGEMTGAVLMHTYAGVLIGPSGLALIAGLTDRFSIAFAACALFGILGAILARLARRAG
ncbi:MFS transporter [Fulvimarina endophytica]|uniref:MFS transporter n=1 Tax=Fulvimarina endophytica TaxID=2293836 RepID=UPI0013149584|nr:MFS transporter [Fulvimarina endophytica]